MGRLGRHWPRRRVRRLEVAALIAAIAVGFGAAAGAASAATSVVMLSEPGDPIGLGESRLFTPADSAIRARLFATGDELTVNVDGGPLGDTFSFDLAAPRGHAFVPGVYDNAERAPFRTAGHPGIDIDGDGRGCNRVAGRLQLLDLAANPDGTVTRLWIAYEQHCEGFAPALFGEIRINEPDGPAPSAVRWPAGDLAAPRTVLPVWFVAAGSTRVTSVSVVGAQAADFPVRLDECTGVSISPGGACQVFVRFVPAAAGEREAALRFTTEDGTTEDVPLRGFAIGGRTQVVMNSDPGDFVGAGVNRLYTPANAAIGMGGNRHLLSFGVSGADGADWFGDFDPGPGDIIAPGRFTGAIRYPFNGFSPGLDFFGDGRGCNTLTGEFTVNSATFAPDGTAQTASVAFIQHCEGAAPALSGTLDFRVGATFPPPGQILVGPLDAAAVNPAPVVLLPPPGGSPAPVPTSGAATTATGTTTTASTATTALPSALVPAAIAPVAGHPLRAPSACPASLVAAAASRAGTARGERILGRAGAEVILAGAGNDRVLGRGGDDCLAGGGGADTLDGGTGSDVLVGGSGRDRLSGGAGADRLSGGPGADVLDGGPGRDVLDCGAGRDVAHVTRGDAVRGCERVLRR